MWVQILPIPVATVTTKSVVTMQYHDVTVYITSAGCINTPPICRKSSTNVYLLAEAKEKYRGVFEIQKSGDKTSSGEIGLDIRTHASPEVGQDQVSGGVSVLCWHAAPVAYVLWEPCTIR